MKKAGEVVGLLYPSNHSPSVYHVMLSCFRADTLWDAGEPTSPSASLASATLFNHALYLYWPPPQGPKGKESKGMEPCNHDAVFQKSWVRMICLPFHNFSDRFSDTGCPFIHEIHIHTWDNHSHGILGLLTVRTMEHQETWALSLLSLDPRHQGGKGPTTKGQQQNHLLQQVLPGSWVSLLRALPCDLDLYSEVRRNTAVWTKKTKRLVSSIWS